MIPPTLHECKWSRTVRGLGIGSIGLFILSPLVDLHTSVPQYTDAEDNNENDELGDHADVAGVGEGDDEADALPEAVVGEGSLLALGEEDAVEGCKIFQRMKDSVQ